MKEKLMIKFDSKGNEIKVDVEKVVEKCKSCGKIREKDTSWVSVWCAGCYCELLRKEDVD